MPKSAAAWRTGFSRFPASASERYRYRKGLARGLAKGRRETAAEYRPALEVIKRENQAIKQEIGEKDRQIGEKDREIGTIKREIEELRRKLREVEGR